jgi:hypothetical protein
VDVVKAIMCHRADACREKARRSVGEKAAEAEGSFNRLSETTGLDRSLGHTAGRCRLQVIVDAEATDDNFGLLRKGGETDRCLCNGRVRCDDEALVESKGEAPFGLKLELDGLGQPGNICTAVLNRRSRAGGGEVVHMK